MKLTIIDGKKNFKLDVYRVGFLGRVTGLMFKSYKTENLLFEFSRNVKLSIHSFFVFFPFVAIWLDNQNKVIEKKIINPFTPLVSPKKEFRKLIEIPFNSKNNVILRKLGFSDGKKRFK